MAQRQLYVRAREDTNAQSVVSLDRFFPGDISSYDSWGQATPSSWLIYHLPCEVSYLSCFHYGRWDGEFEITRHSVCQSCIYMCEPWAALTFLLIRMSGKGPKRLLRGYECALLFFQRLHNSLELQL